MMHMQGFVWDMLAYLALQHSGAAHGYVVLALHPLDGQHPALRDSPNFENTCKHISQPSECSGR